MDLLYFCEIYSKRLFVAFKNDDSPNERQRPAEPPRTRDSIYIYYLRYWQVAHATRQDKTDRQSAKFS